MDYDKEVIEPGDRFSELAHRICNNSADNSPAMIIKSASGGFRGKKIIIPRRQILEQIIAGTIGLTAQSDGAGGKPQFFTLVPKAFRNLPWEIITMNADDLACSGGSATTILSSNLDIKSINKQNWLICEELLYGLENALEDSNLAMFTGETAVMKDSITAFCDTGDPEQLILTWNATCFGVDSISRPENGSTIKPGMTVIGFKDQGYRCNGGTKFTDIVLNTWGPDIHDIMNNDEAMAFIEKLVVPSRSYAGTISRLNGWQLDGTLNDPVVQIHGAAHITGGGVWSKLAGILPEGTGVELDTMPEPTPVLFEGQLLSHNTDKPMSDYDCYGDFHGACGMMLVCAEADVARVCAEADKDGHEPSIIGKTIPSPNNEIIIHSQFNEGTLLSSLRPH